MGAGGTSNEDFLLLRFPQDIYDKEIVWFIGNFCDIVAKQVLGKKKRLTSDRVSGLIKSRLSTLQTRAVVVPQIYNI